MVGCAPNGGIWELMGFFKTLPPLSNPPMLARPLLGHKLFLPKRRGGICATVKPALAVARLSRGPALAVSLSRSQFILTFYEANLPALAVESDQKWTMRM